MYHVRSIPSRSPYNGRQYANQEKENSQLPKQLCMVGTENATTNQPPPLIPVKTRMSSIFSSSHHQVISSCHCRSNPGLQMGSTVTAQNRYAQGHPWLSTNRSIRWPSAVSVECNPAILIPIRTDCVGKWAESLSFGTRCLAS